MNEGVAGWSSDINGAEKERENSSLCWQLLLPYSAEAAPAWSGFFLSLSLSLSPFLSSFVPSVLLQPQAQTAAA